MVIAYGSRVWLYITNNNVWETQEMLFYILICIERYYLSYDCIFLVLTYSPVVCPPSLPWCHIIASLQSPSQCPGVVTRPEKAFIAGIEAAMNEGLHPSFIAASYLAFRLARFASSFAAFFSLVTPFKHVYNE